MKVGDLVAIQWPFLGSAERRIQLIVATRMDLQLRERTTFEHSSRPVVASSWTACRCPIEYALRSVPSGK